MFGYVYLLLCSLDNNDNNNNNDDDDDDDDDDNEQDDDIDDMSCLPRVASSVLVTVLPEGAVFSKYVDSE